MPVSSKPADDTKGQIPDVVLYQGCTLYGFDTTWSLLPIVPMNGELVVLNAKSETTSKAVLAYQGERYLLKRVPWYCAEKSFIQFMLSFEGFLDERGFSVPHLQKTADGALFVSVGEGFFYLQRFCSGLSFQGSMTEAYQAGAALGQLHHLSELYGKAIDITQLAPYKETVFAIGRNMIRVVEEIISKADSRLTPSELESLTRFTRVGVSTCGYQSVVMPIHGDYNPYNLLFHEDGQVLAVFDWENTAIDNPAHDVAEGLLDFAYWQYRPHSTRFAGLPTVLDVDLAGAFINGYRSTNPALYQTVRGILPQVAGAVFFELFALGLARGDYQFQDAGLAASLWESLAASVKDLS
jgi:Ser/Thr protein kinase RdoA (MazF antagonist)